MGKLAHITIHSLYIKPSCNKDVRLTTDTSTSVNCVYVDSLLKLCSFLQ